MNKDEFLYEAKKVVYEHIAINTNLVITGNKTSAAIATLFSNIPVNITLRKISNTPGKKKKLWSLSQSCSAYLKHDDQFKIYFTFFYSKDSDLPKLMKAIHKHDTYFGYIYIREMLRLTRNHNTRPYYDRMSTHLAKTNAPRDSYYALMLAASDYAINSYVRALYAASGQTSTIEKLLKHQRYDASVLDDELSILQKIATEDYGVAAWSDTEDFQMVESDTTECIQFTDFDLVNDELEEQIVDLGESLQQAMGVAARGTATAGIFEEIFTKQPIKQGQLKKLKKSLRRKVHEMTNDYSSTWASLNTTYRHKFKSPKKEFWDHKLNIVLSIDQSGSMDYRVLGKLLALIEEIGKKVVKLTVLIHDSEVSKTFVLESMNGITSDPQFKNALATRYQSGGTSHYHVFRTISEMPSAEREKLIYFSFSDNYSDIPTSWEVFPELKAIPSYFINPIDNPVKLKGSVTNIHLI